MTKMEMQIKYTSGLITNGKDIMSIVHFVVIACHWFHQRVSIASLSFYTTLTATGHSSLLSISSLITVPCKKNGYNCGIYVCRYAYGLYVMKHLLFTWRDYTEDPPFNTLTLEAMLLRFPSLTSNVSGEKCQL